MRPLSIAERLGMAEARGARLEARILKQETVIDALRAQVARMDAAMRGLLRPTPAPKPVEIEDNPAIVCAALSAARMSDIAAQVALLRGISQLHIGERRCIHARVSERRSGQCHQQDKQSLHCAAFSAAKMAGTFSGRMSPICW